MSCVDRFLRYTMLETPRSLADCMWRGFLVVSTIMLLDVLIVFGSIYALYVVFTGRLS